MNIKDAYTHNGEDVLKDIRINDATLQKKFAGKDANDNYKTWEDVKDLSKIEVMKARTEIAYKTGENDVGGHWTVAIPGITELYDGLKIHIKLSTSYYGNKEGYNTLNVNSLGPQLVWYRYDHTLTTHFPKGSEVTLTYRNSGCKAYTIPTPEEGATPGELTAGTKVTSGWVANYAYYSTSASTADISTYAANLGSKDGSLAYTQIKSLHDWYTTATEADTDAIINKWNEVIRFLSSVKDDETNSITLASIMNGYLPLAGGTMTGNITLDENAAFIVGSDTKWTNKDRGIPFSSVSGSGYIKYYSDDTTKGLTFNPFSGVLRTGSLTILDTNPVAHIKFSSSNYNYITIPEKSALVFEPGTSIAATNGMTLDSAGFSPSATKAYNLGTESRYWNNIYGNTIYQDGIKVSVEGHKHATSLAINAEENSSINLSCGGKYKLTSADNSIVFTLPSAGNYFVKGTQTQATNVWTGDLPTNVTDYYDGLSIDYYLPYAGNGSNVTLNLGGKGAKKVQRGDSTGSATTHFPQYSVIHLTYIASLDSGNGAWRTSAYYDSRNYENSRPYYQRFCSGANPISAYKICGVDVNGKVQPLVLTAGNNQKTVNTTPLKLNEFYYYNASDTTDSNTLLSHGILWTQYYFHTCDYTFNETASPYCDVYLCGTISNGLFVLDNTTFTSFAKFVPNNDTKILNLANYFSSGKYYIKLGRTYSSENCMGLDQVHPLFYFDGANLLSCSLSTVYAAKLGSSTESLSYADIKKAYNLTTNNLWGIFTLLNSGTVSVSSAGWTEVCSLPADSGSYMVQINCNGAIATGMYSVVSGDTVKDEIPLHVSGATAAWRIYARTEGGKLKLSSTDTSATNRTVTIKSKRIL